MNLTFIGCGDSFADKLGNNSALLEWREHRLLIDLPDSNYSRIKELGLDYSDIDHLFITHLHADHINGLERFAYYRQFATPVVRPEKAGVKPNLYLPETLYEGLWDSVKHGLGVTQQGVKRLEDYFDVHLIKVRDESNNVLQGINGVGAFTIGDVEFRITPSKHVPNMPVYGLFVKDAFYYSADSVYDTEAIAFYLHNTKKIFHDMHFYPQDLASHASVRDFASLRETEKEKVYAMHYDDSKTNVFELDGIKLVKPFQKIAIKEEN